MTSIDLNEWRRVHVTGSDAFEWLQDLVSAAVPRDQEDIPYARRSLLLTPTGRIRAEFHIVYVHDGFLLIQDPVQPKPVDELLAPYVLSSDVALAPLENNPYAILEGEGVVTPIGWTMVEPDRGLSVDEFDEWRVHEGLPRFGVDLDEDSLPQEAGWERFIDFTKGCFMGQEAMAKIRNMNGHPTRLIRALRADESVQDGERLFAEGQEVGVVTSAADTDVMVRVRWDARNEALVTEGGAALRDR
jgi:folate-binding protein YgfZ